MRRVLTGLLLGLSCGWVNAYACDRAAAVFALEKARSLAPAERSTALEESIAACPSYQAWLMKGGAHFALKQYEEAIQALRQARQIADELHLAGLALARIAQVYAYQDDFAVAQNLADKAYKELDWDKIPGWLT
ncbi:MAG: hypothetical protein KDJ99_25285, partial [Candidatus Competibacteraceae bacterium]|nr:hypothetical protein [Candidatus Competibacteraceae bacterium]